MPRGCLERKCAAVYIASLLGLCHNKLMRNIVFYDVSDEERSQLEQAFGAGALLHQEKLTAELLDPATEVLSVFVNSMVDRATIEALPHLELIACRSTGFNNVDLEAAREHNVAVVNVPSYGSRTVAEYTFGLLLSLTRKLPRAIAAALSGDEATSLQGSDLHGKTLGIIGTGHIGTCVAQIARGFEMKVIAHDVLPRDELAKKYNFTYQALDTLLAQSDILTLHVPYTPENHHLINASRLAKIKHGALLINTARGELVDNRALIDALQGGQLGGAALDVLEGEQLLSQHEELLLLRSGDAPLALLRHSLEISLLQKLPNVIITHHNAFNTREAIQRINATTIDNIKQFLADAPINVVKA